MNKQQISSQPGMPQSVPQVPPMMYQQQQPQTYYPRAPHGRALTTLNQRPSPVNVPMNPSSNVAAPQQYYQQLQSMSSMGVQISGMPPIGSIYMNPNAAGVSQYRQPFQSYPMHSQTQQAMYHLTPGSSTSFPGYPPAQPQSHSPLVYYNVRPSQAMGPSNPPPKREKRFIRIQDPDTEKDITDDLLGVNCSSAITASASGPPSARETPPSTATPPPRNTDVGVQFATQVALVVSETIPKEQPLSIPVTRTPPISEKPPDIRELKAAAATKQPEETVVASNSIKPVEKSSESNICLGLKIEAKPIVTPPRPHMHSPFHPIVVDGSEEKRVEAAKPGVKSEFPESTKAPFPAVETTVKPEMPLAPVILASPKQEVVAEEPSPLVVKEAEIMLLPPVVEDVKEPEPVLMAEQEDMEEPPPSPAAVAAPAVVAIAVEPATSSVEEAKPLSLPHENGDVLTHELSEFTQEPKDAKKPKGKKKQNNLNKKGESKEGGDMDAFVDKDEVLPAALHSSVQDTFPTTEDLLSKEEQRKVAEKNEENAKVSREFERNELEGTPVIERTIITKPPPALKYQYKEEQWSPLNPEGKRQYDRAFLLHMQSQPMSLKKPEGLPDLEIIKDIVSVVNNKKPIESRPSSLSVSRNMIAVPDFTPGYVKSTPRGPQIRSRASQQGKNEPKVKKSFNVTLSQDVKLNKAENAWKPLHKLNVGVDPEIQKTEELYRTVRGILNKLTPQKFQTLVGQVNNLLINTEERLKGVIDLVFEKAIDEPNFSVAYANLCKCLAMMKVPLNSNEGDFVNFRKLLLNKCQKEFENDISDEVDREQLLKEIDSAESEEKKKELSDELKDAERRAKRRSLGNIRFIGELFKLHMLTATIMHDCLKKLISQEDEDSLECLCRLLTTIGKDMDSEKPKSGKDVKDTAMNLYFKQMEEIVHKKQTTSRVRFMLQDVIDLRSCNWVPRRDENNPKTIDQIHQEAQREASEREAALQAAPHRRLDDRDKRKRSGAMGGQGSVGDDGWNTVSGKNSARIDPSKMKLSKPMDEDNIQLGPGGRNFSGWGRGSSGGSRTSSQEPEAKSSIPANRFQPLASDQSGHDSRRGIMRTPTPGRDSSKGRGTQMMPSQRSNMKPAVQSSKEREQAIAAVKNIAGGEAGRSRSEEVQENNVAREEPAPVRKPPATPTVSSNLEMQLGTVELSELEIENKTKSVIDEFVHTNDSLDATAYVIEFCSHSTVHLYVTNALNHVLERSTEARTCVGQLINYQVKQSVMTLEECIEGLKGISSFSQELSIDVPRFWEYYAEMLVPILQAGTMPLSCLKEVAQPCLEAGTAGYLISAVLHALARIMGPQKVGDLWRASGLTWSYFLPSDGKQDSFVSEHRLEFTIAARGARVADHLSMESIKTELHSLFKRKADSEDIFDWIDTHVTTEQCQEAAFVRALMTALVEGSLTGTDLSVSLDSQLLRQRCTILQKYLDHKEEFELQSLYAIQALMHRLEHPKGMIGHIIEVLHDEDAISEEAFLQWEVSEDPAEQEGKQAAVNSLSAFFTWLREMDNESVEES